VLAHDILQPTHLLIILLAVLLVLGPKKLPQASRAVGKSLREFRQATSLEPPAKVAADSSESTDRSA
jgi:sec-independent protein translocase protein TatA